jgi:hypothetical protein
MALKKKGTPTKIEIFEINPTDSELEQWKKLIEKSINEEPFTIISNAKIKVKGKKKNKS